MVSEVEAKKDNNDDHSKKENLQGNVKKNFDYPARALRALGLLLADGAPTVGGGKTF